MTMPTATIRVPAETRDVLARQARADGLSLAAMLTRQAERFAREQWFADERAAARADAADPAVVGEQELWEAADDDWD
jgi:hypothetical protein